MQKCQPRCQGSLCTCDSAPECAIAPSGGQISVISRASDCRFGGSREPSDFCNRLLGCGAARNCADSAGRLVHYAGGSRHPAAARSSGPRMPSPAASNRPSQYCPDIALWGQVSNYRLGGHPGSGTRPVGESQMHAVCVGTGRCRDTCPVASLLRPRLASPSEQTSRVSRNSRYRIHSGASGSFHPGPPRRS